MRQKCSGISHVPASVGTLRTNENGTPFLDVTFKCDFSKAKKGVLGGPIDVRDNDLSTVPRFAECAYERICELLAKQRKAARGK